MAKAKKKKVFYFVASIVSMPSLGEGMMFIDDDKEFVGKTYNQAYSKALLIMKTVEAVTAVLIFSSNETAIVIKRKWAA